MENFFSFLFTLIKKNRFKFTGLISGFIFLTFLFPAITTSFKAIYPPFTHNWILYISLQTFWFIYWYFDRNFFPETSKGKIGIVLAIATHSKKQESRIKEDLLDKMKQLMANYKMGDVFQISFLSDSRAERAIDILTRYGIDCLRVRRQLKDGKPIKKEPRSFKLWKMFQKKTKAHFFIWGSIKERQDEKNKYIIKTDALVTHRPIPVVALEAFQKELLSVFPKEISFYESFESKGFELAANLLSLVATYIIGTAACISGNVPLALSLHLDLKNKLNNLPQQKPISHMAEQLKEIIVSERFVLAKHAYYVKKDNNETKKLINECLSDSPNRYEILIFQSVINFAVDENPSLSLKTINKARKNSKGDFTWLYNKAFLQMYVGKYERGLKSYHRIARTQFPNEQNIVEQCLNFNQGLIESKPSHSFPYFVIGFLNWKKKDNLPLALDHFEKFINEAKNTVEIKPIYDYSLSSIGEIKSKMKL